MDLGSSSVEAEVVAVAGGAEVIDLDALLVQMMLEAWEEVLILILIQILIQYSGSDNIFSLDNNTTTFGNTAQASGSSPPPVAQPLPNVKTFEEIQAEKQELRLLDRLEAKGVKLSKDLLLIQVLIEMQAEYKRITERRAVEQSVKISEKDAYCICNSN